MEFRGSYDRNHAVSPPTFKGERKPRFWDLAAGRLSRRIEQAYRDNLTESEIARAAGCSRATVHRHLRRYLREHWSNYLDHAALLLTQESELPLRLKSA